MKKHPTTLLLFCVLTLLAAACTAAQTQNQSNYAVLVGLAPEDAAVLTNYQTVVIDAQYFTKEEIASIQQAGTQVYTYLNIGSIETFREGYESVKDCILSPYENWPGEYWVDVSRPEWQAFVADEAKSLAEKGVSGFFLDNADVFHLYPSEAIYEGLNATLQMLAPFGKPVLINGGDVFVSRAVLNAALPTPVITGVNQECVFTNIDFTSIRLIRQDEETTAYYEEYLTRCKSAGLDVYLTEYAGAGDRIASTIKRYCADNGFSCFISASANLDKP